MTIEKLFDEEDHSRAEYETRGIKFVLTRDPVYGFWSIALGKGGHLPEALHGKFTGLEVAKQQIAAYANSIPNKKEV